jgi:putative endopeptidase
MTYLRNRASHPRVSAVLLATALAVAPACRTTPSSSAAGIDLAGMDKSVAPGDDFNAYTNGGWIKATPIPADKSSYGAGAILADETRERLRALFQESSSAAAATGDARKIGDFYSSFMDEAAIESKGIAPLKPQLDGIAAIADRHALARVLGGQLRADVDPLNNTNFETGNLFGIWIAQGLSDPSHNFPLSAPGRSRNAGPRLLYLHHRPYG